jgi:hypothetical protein
LPTNLPAEDEDAIRAKIEAVTVYMTEVESFSTQDIRDMFTDTLACVSRLVWGTDTPPTP